MPTDLHRAAAKMLYVGFDGREPTIELLELIDAGVSGVVLFARNLGSPREIAQLCATIKRAAKRPILISIDHEGGRVIRRRDGFTPIPSMRAIGRANDVALARTIGQIMARELRAVNIDLNFAPVVDVDTNPANPVIGDRSFSNDPQSVARLACEMIESMQSNGIAACAKHFPGHGDTELDSHLALPALSHELSRLREIELPPFEATVRCGVASIMTAHVIFRAIDPELPATMSGPVLRILREEMRFDGVIISDDLEMKATADHFGVERAIVSGTNAGVDLFLVCHTPGAQRAAVEAIVNGVEAGAIDRAMLDQAGRRIDRMIEQYCRAPEDTDPTSICGCADHRAAISELSSGDDPTRRENWA